MPKARPFDAAEYQDDPKMIAKYLNHALATGDAALITKAIGDMVFSALGSKVDILDARQFRPLVPDDAGFFSLEILLPFVS